MDPGSVAGWLVLFVGVPALAYYYLRRVSQSVAEFDARTESAGRLRVLTALGVVGVGMVDWVVAAVTGSGTGLESVVAGTALAAVAPPFVYRMLAIACGPMLVGSLAAHHGVAPYLNALLRRSTLPREYLPRFARSYLLAVGPLAAAVALAHVAPGPQAAALLVAVAAVAYVAASPSLLAAAGAAREPTAAESSVLAGIEGPDDVAVRVLADADPDTPLALATGLVPGHRAVLLRAALFEDLAPGDVRAVLAHEYGHFRVGSIHRTAAFQAVTAGAWAWAWAGGLSTTFSGTVFGLFVTGAVGVSVYHAGTVAIARNEQDRADDAAAEQVGAHGMARELLRVGEFQAPSSMWAFERNSIPGKRIGERVDRLEPRARWATPPIPTRT